MGSFIQNHPLVYLSACLLVCLSVCLSLSVCLFAGLPACLFVCLIICSSFSYPKACIPVSTTNLHALRISNDNRPNLKESK